MDTTFGAAIADPADAAGPDRYQPSLLALSGRIGRLRYFTYSSALVLVLMLVVCVIYVLFSPVVAVALLGLAYLAFVPAVIILMVRRLNDLDRSGWYALGAIVPFVNVALSLYATFAPGSDGRNRFGPAPVANSQAGMFAAVAILAAAFAIGFAAARLGVTIGAV